MGSKKVALIRNDEICYGTLKFSSEKIASVLSRHGFKPEFCSSLDENFFLTDWAAVIGINEYLLSVKTEEGGFAFDYLNCPLFEIIVDPPYYHEVTLSEHPKNMHLICLDEGHAEYCKKYYEPFQSVEMGYIVGNLQEGLPFSERKIDVLFSGTGPDPHIEEEMKKYPKPVLQELYHFLIDAGITNPNFSTEKGVLAFLDQKNIRISAEDFRLVMAVSGMWSELWLRAYYREKVMRCILEAGISVTVAGSRWEGFQKEFPELFHWKGSLNYADTNTLMGNSKILLNVMPWFKDGLHDRIPTSMHCGAVCVTDGSSYIESHFKDGEEIVLYDLAKLNQIPEKIRYLLEHEETACKIANKGHKKAMEQYTWDNMVENNILKYIQ